MSSPRIKRLQSDYDEISSRYCGAGPIRMRTTRGNPPERYEFDYHVEGLELLADGRIVGKKQHAIEVVLTTGYPSMPPKCKMLTPIFHPNIDASAICIGDHWAASESLADLLGRIGELITFQAYNIKSPLNAEAARWAAENQNLFPLQIIDFFLSESPDAAPPSSAKDFANSNPLAKCENCHSPAANGALTEISPDRFFCTDCLHKCPCCGAVIGISDQLCSACGLDSECDCDLARDCMERGEFEAALRGTKIILDRHPGYSTALELRNQILSTIQRIQDAAAESEISYQEKKYVRFLELARELHGLGYHSAELDARRAELEPVFEEARQNTQCAIDAFADNPAELIAALEAVVQRCPHFTPASEALSQARTLLWDLEEKAVKFAPVLQRLAGKKRLASSQIQRMEELIRELDAALRLLKRDREIIAEAKRALDIQRPLTEARIANLQIRARKSLKAAKWMGAFSAAAVAALTAWQMLEGEQLWFFFPLAWKEDIYSKSDAISFGAAAFFIAAFGISLLHRLFLAWSLKRA